MIRGKQKCILNSIGVFSFGSLVDSEEQEIENRFVACLFLNWVGKCRDLEVGNLRDENLGT
jgi:hypothetical protein